jgi:hypothetical protein
MDRSALLARQADAIEQGYESALSGGRSATNPTDLATQLSQAGPEVLPGLRIGTRAALENSLGTKANDLAALRNELQFGNGQGNNPSWNQQKLGMIFSPQAADDLANTVNREATFSQTNNDVARNSMTAQRQSAASGMRPSVGTDNIPLINPGSTIPGMITTGAKRLGASILQSVLPDPTRAYGEVADILTAQGPQRDAYVSALVDALQRRSSNAQAAQAIGNNASLIAGLLRAPAASDLLPSPAHQGVAR